MSNPGSPEKMAV